MDTRWMVLALLLTGLLMTLSAAPALAANGDCGQPVSSGTRATLSDALFILRAGVGEENCDNCVCDVDSSGMVTTTDALIATKAVVGHPGVELLCPCFPTTTTTSTTIPGNVSIITFTLDDAVNLGALQFVVGYANAAGNFIANAFGPGWPDCTTNPVLGGFGGFNDDTGVSVVSVGLISLAGFWGPTDVVTCRFDGAPRASDFTLTVTDASDPLTNPVAPLPGVSISVAPE